MKKPGKAYYNALCNTPYGNDLLLEFTKQVHPPGKAFAMEPMYFQGVVGRQEGLKDPVIAQQLRDAAQK